MNFSRRGSQVTPKIVNLYSKLFRGTSVTQAKGPNQTKEQFYAELLTLDLDRAFITGQLEGVSKDACLGLLKGFLNSWFKACIHWARSGNYGDVKKIHALETLIVIVRGMFAKSLSGWEIMDALAGSVNESDAVFTEFTNMVADILSDAEAPVNIKHLTLQLALVYMCRAGQTSLGSYFLRRDLFPTIVSLVKSRDTGKFTFEATLFLCVLANFHRSDAARLNPYFRRLSVCDDIVFLQKTIWATDFALQTAVQSYRHLSDDTPPQNLATGIVSLFAAWRPDKALSATPVDPPKELFKDQPIEAAVALLPIFELIHSNRIFPSILADSLSTPKESKVEGIEQPLSLVLLTTISLSSYILAHASSTSSPRASAYAILSLKTLLAFTESLDLMATLFEPTQHTIQLSRQRLPTLPLHSDPRAPVCGILDCCVLWFRHNLQYKLDVVSYMCGGWPGKRVQWCLCVNQIRLEYDWKGLWSAILGLLNFVAFKAQSIPTSNETAALFEETVALLEFTLSQCEKILPSAKALHDFIYELIRFSDGIRKFQEQIHDLGMEKSSSSRRTIWLNGRTTNERLNSVMDIVNFYQDKISKAGARTAKEALRVVAQAIESEGLYGVKSNVDSEPPKRVEDAIGFIRFGYSDILALMP